MGVLLLVLPKLPCGAGEAGGWLRGTQPEKPEKRESPHIISAAGPRGAESCAIGPLPSGGGLLIWSAARRRR